MTKNDKQGASPHPEARSAEADPKSLTEAGRIQRATGTAAAALEAARLRLLADVRMVKPGRVAIVDGEPAVVDDEELEPVTWLRDRVQEICSRGTLNEAIEELRREALADALEKLAKYVREHREEILRMAKPRPE